MKRAPSSGAYNTSNVSAAAYRTARSSTAASGILASGVCGTDDLLGERHLEAADVGKQVQEVHERLGRHPMPAVDHANAMPGRDALDDRGGLVGESDAVVAAVAIEIEQRVLRHEHDDR